MAEFMVSCEFGPVSVDTPQQAAAQVFEELRDPASYPPMLEVTNLETDEVTLVDIQKEDYD